MGKPYIWIPVSLGMGLLGAAIWAAIAYFANFEIGWIAWIIGGMVGFGAAYASPDEPSVPRGLIAAVIALASIFAGKLATVHFVVDKVVAESGVGDIDAYRARVLSEDPDYPVAVIADAIAVERMDRGETINWPNGSSYEYAIEKQDFPQDIWSDATRRWNAMSSPEKEDYLDEHFAYIQSVAASFEPSVSDMSALVFDALGPLDALFAVLAVITAFSVGGQIRKQ